MGGGDSESVDRDQVTIERPVGREFHTSCWMKIVIIFVVMLSLLYHPVVPLTGLAQCKYILSFMAVVSYLVVGSVDDFDSCRREIATDRLTPC